MSENNIFTAKIEEMNTLGNGITKQDGCVVFCLGAVDGDTVTAEITEEKKNYKIAVLKSIDTPSEHRCETDCPAQGCGGCTLRHITYEHETDIKLQSVKNALRRGGLGNINVREILTASPDRYRNKAVFRFKGSQFGYTEEKGSDFIPVADCLLCPAIFSKIAAYTADALADLSITYLFLRCTDKCEEITAVIGTKDTKSTAKLTDFAAKLCERFPSVVGVLTKCSDHPEDGKRAELILGKDHISENFLGMTLKVSPDSFFQVNHDAAEKLCRRVGEYACPDSGSYGADLYCGTGIIGLSSAALHPDCFITGVEINSAAVADAKENAAANGLSNIGFFCGDSADFAKSIYGSLDFATIDPPRQGCSDKMIKELIRISPKRLVYVSCDPSSLARDLKKLCEKSFTVEEVTACDLFPRTKHVETVVLLKSTKNK